MLSDSGNPIAHYRWAGTQRWVAGKEAGQRVWGREQKATAEAEQEDKN